MPTLNVMVVLGTRPEAIKLAPVIRTLQRRADRIRTLVCSTGQHREMLDAALRSFAIRLDFDLQLMRPDQSLADSTARILAALDAVFNDARPDWVLTQGDTTTAMAASLAAFYRRIRIGHVEAGLRSGNLQQPFPEEANRRIADLLADLHFAPTATARDHLLREGIPAERIIVTGNTVVDALLITSRRINARALIERIGELGTRDDCFRKRMILVTAHRRESFGAPFANICRALRTIAERYPDVQIVYPVHYNPNIAGPAQALLSGVPNIALIRPVDYETMIALMQHAYLILTDSGGIQEEAPSLHKPVLILREVTERPEVVTLGAARLVGSHPDRIVAEASRLLDDREAYRRMTSVENPYGDGRASERIVEAILARDS
ncbi:MAG: UDP-N-acetylglucosamine 2-epimerase (non-hydrolyzing) [Chloroflexi bacterium]|jgi:UDP-N-acetylglucosamine 2-epimerase (hydrolysing)|uniref:non-hydrolyzing UDP-N-acetylglucosamine 2-epimerase n=1 Tax=Candidatus Roseilinea sp. NK_OTU-006 TaxID=2704250 RepID=UPI000F242279|nr:UDP-N-acetylglucosamine 2-epimerase (non-hydrolyzing) [Candidatus Roseilinea sp. NK_OTU-006]RMG61753.1 MAG: UDP-N-acetylglucosamine 2-epimerase (non-hydrolyzing) [Chloroflexota bacterium]